MAGGTRVISTHLSPTKDRSLAATLLRVSERGGLQEDFQVETVVYCGNDEPFSGWTNVIPIARYSESNKPRDPTAIMKKKRTKPRLKQLDEKDSVSDIYSELLGMTTRADGHYHATANLQELYEEYKKRQNVGDRFKLRGMVDPITFRYIPIEDRMEMYDSDDESSIRLPVLKMTHANKQAKLLEVLENFVNRPQDDRRTESEKHSILAKDAASFYDKYRWYYKDRAGNISKKIKVKKRNKKHGRKKLGYAGYISGSESEESSSIRRRSKRSSHPPSYVIQIKDDESHTLKEETITFEKKVDYALSAPGAPGIDRWVARVVIKDHSTKTDSDTMTSSTMSQTTIKSSNSQIEKLKQLRAKRSRNQAKNQQDFRLAKKKPQKNKRRLPSSFYEIYHMSAIEATKVQVNFDINAGKRQGAITGNSSSTATSSESKKLDKKSTIKPTPIHPRKIMDENSKLEPKAQKVMPLSKTMKALEQELVDSNIPLPPTKTKRSPRLSGNATKDIQVKKRQRVTKFPKEGAPLFSSQQVFESSEERQVKTPSSSTFNPDRMFRQMKDTADFITKASKLSKARKSIQTSTRQMSHIEDARSTKGHLDSSTSDVASRKPLHPKQNRNAAQDKIQQMIDDEKALVSQVIKKLNSTWRDDSPGKLESVPESLEDALSTAIAKARIYDAENGMIPGRSSHLMMKRKVVPPLKEKAITATTLGSDESLFIPENSRTLGNSKPRLPNFRPTVQGKMTQDSMRGHTFSKSVRSLSNDRNNAYKSNKSQVPARFIADGDLLISKPHGSIHPSIFEASISSMKPSRRIANVNQPFDVRQRA